EALYKNPARAIFINPFDMARPGQIRDGFFPDAVFADPRYVLPVIEAALDEWLDGRPVAVSAFIGGLARYGGLAAQVARGARALMAHGLVSSIGLKHYKYNPKYNDTELARRKLNRVTDTLEPETNLDTVE